MHRAFSMMSNAFDRTLGEPAKYRKPPATEWNDVRVIFAPEYQAAMDDGQGNVVHTIQPMASMRAALVPNLAQGDQLEIDGVVYVVGQYLPNGVGMLDILLERTV